MIALTKDNNLSGFGLLASEPGIFHFVTTRRGGCSEGNYGSMNCTSYTGDNPEHVSRNIHILTHSLPQRPTLILPYQTHSTNILEIDGNFLAQDACRQQSELQQVDALMTQEQGCAVCISTADCIPVLLYDRKRKAVAAVHAGWRGTVGRIVLKTLERMNWLWGTEGADVLAGIGPGISLESFEVGEEVYETFHQAGFDMPAVSCRNQRTGKWHLDLWEANRIQLKEFGIPAGQIEIAGVCTYIHYKDYFSARRLGIRSGRILSGIYLRK